MRIHGPLIIKGEIRPDYSFIEVNENGINNGYYSGILKVSTENDHHYCYIEYLMPMRVMNEYLKYGKTHRYFECKIRDNSLPMNHKLFISELLFIPENPKV